MRSEIIRTSRLILRPFSVDDYKEMFSSWVSDEEVTRFLTWSSHEDSSVTKLILSEWAGHYKEEDYLNWAVVYNEYNALIGNISAVSYDKDLKQVEIGYCYSRRYWGKGLATEALKAVIDFIFSHSDTIRIQAKHDVLNPASGRVMEKAGMRREGVLRKASKNRRGIVDVAIYSILRDDWIS